MNKGKVDRTGTFDAWGHEMFLFCSIIKNVKIERHRNNLRVKIHKMSKFKPL